MNRWKLAWVVWVGMGVAGGMEFARADAHDDTAIRSERKVVGDAAVHYLTAGPADGREVVLLHGQKFTSAVWVQTGTIKLLAELGYRVVAVDLPGFGDSPATTQDVDKWLSVAVRTLCNGRPVIVAPSMSGRFALPFLTSEPDRMAGFVALAPVALKPYRQKLVGIKVPTLALWGSKDSVVPPDQSTWLVEAMPNVRRVIVPGARHTVYTTNTKEFHDELAQFLANLPWPTTQPADESAASLPADIGASEPARSNH